jgi:hypothetical protein
MMYTTTAHLRSPAQRGAEHVPASLPYWRCVEQEECPMLTSLFEAATTVPWLCSINNDANAGCQREKKHNRDAFR